jgi:hypothetical protein
VSTEPPAKRQRVASAKAKDAVEAAALLKAVDPPKRRGRPPKSIATVAIPSTKVEKAEAARLAKIAKAKAAYKATMAKLGEDVDEDN